MASRSLQALRDSLARGAGRRRTNFRQALPLFVAVCFCQARSNYFQAPIPGVHSQIAPFPKRSSDKGTAVDESGVEAGQVRQERWWSTDKSSGRTE